MYKRLARLIPIVISYMLALTLVFIALLSPLIFLAVPNLRLLYILLFLLAVFSVSSAMVGIVVYQMISPLATVKVRESKKRKQ